MTPSFASAGLWAGLAFLVFVSGCAARETVRSPDVPIGRDVFLALPMPPGYAGDITLLQTVQGAYGTERRTFQSWVSLAADEVRVIMTVPSGPRIMTIHWSAHNVTTERTALAPAELAGENVLADIMITLWAVDAVGAALSGDATIAEDDGVRTIRSAGRDVITARNSDGPLEHRRTVLTNHDFGYQLEISSQRTDGG